MSKYVEIIEQIITKNLKLLEITSIKEVDKDRVVFHFAEQEAEYNYVIILSEELIRNNREASKFFTALYKEHCYLIKARKMSKAEKIRAIKFEWEDIIIWRHLGRK